ncbi:MAG: tRNA (guanosine(37)-N1)-methyltransferase TrmD [Acidobacteria bacterium]|nr:MAG: tRNA (guanosine(37)-N1)-methyltransferase TrmD [Acidobacteriota bacterium]
MEFDVVTIFPDFFGSILAHGVLKRATAGGQLAVRLHDLRDFTEDRHRTVDDRPFGGGPGMVLKPEPIFRAVESIKSEQPGKDLPVVLLSPQGRLLQQSVVEDLSRHSRITLVCGRYEGMDERVAEGLVTDELSIGDYVLSGGEIAAAVVMECVARLIPGVLGNEESVVQDSFGNQSVSGRRVLDWPHYTRPGEFRGMRVPEVLLSGNHEEIRRWRRRKALEKTWRKRPELLAGFPLDEEDRQVLEDLKQAPRLPVLPRQG